MAYVYAYSHSDGDTHADAYLGGDTRPHTDIDAYGYAVPDANAHAAARSIADAAADS